jgi:glycerophosphoryl diester phosphodiesterase
VTWVIAHRGASRDRPENTFAAFREALRQGCDGIELDLQRSRDGVAVVYHDRTMARAGGGRRRLSALDWSELRKLSPAGGFEGAHGRERIPRLDQVLRRFGERTKLLLEIKVRGDTASQIRLAEEVALRVAELSLQRRVMFLSFEPAVLDALAEEEPGLSRVLNVKPPVAVDATLKRRMARVDVVSADVRSLTEEFADTVHDLGRSLMVFTCNTPRRVELALRCGARGIMTDRPGWLRGYLVRGTESA